MIKIAVVGDIGSGKSHIAKLFGYPVFNADQEVASIYKKNKNCFKKLKKNLPKYFSVFPANKIQIIKAIGDSEKNLKKIKKIDFIKLDVDGHELDVLKSGEKILKTKRPIIFIEIAPYLYPEFGYKCSELINYIKKLKYSFYLKYFF